MLIDRMGDRMGKYLVRGQSVARYAHLDRQPDNFPPGPTSTHVFYYMFIVDSERVIGTISYEFPKKKTN